MELNTYPNSFKTDTIYEDIPLLYSFESTYDLSVKTLVDKSLYIKGGNQKLENIKFNNKTYYFNGIRLTKNKDIIDENNDYEYTLFIEGSNTMNYIYIGIPVKYVDISLETDHIASIFNEESEFNSSIISDDLINELMPIEEYYYHYKTDKMFDQDKYSNIILFSNSTLKTNYTNTSLEKDDTTLASIPLVRSKDYPYYSSYISSNMASDKIYIDCQPVELLGQENDIQVSGENNSEKIYNFIEIGLGFILMFILLKLILQFTN